MHPVSIINKKILLAIIGLGNPGPKFEFTPHNVGFLILDELREKYHGDSWQEKNNMLVSTISINDKKLFLVKPQTFMNDSGKILPQLSKQGIKQENLFVVHDEIDFKFGKITFKDGGSARGHNGLRSLIAHGGDKFARLRVGVGKPDDKSHVGNFVTSPFQESNEEVTELIKQAVEKTEELF